MVYLNHYYSTLQLVHKHQLASWHIHQHVCEHNNRIYVRICVSCDLDRYTRSVYHAAHSSYNFLRQGSSWLCGFNFNRVSKVIAATIQPESIRMKMSAYYVKL